MNREIEEPMRFSGECLPELLGPGAAAMKPSSAVFTPFEPGTELAGLAPRLPRGLLRQLKKRLESGAGRRGAELAEIALRAGFNLPARRQEIPADMEALQAALWMALVRENAELRRQAARLRQRKASLTLRIRRTRSRLQALRVRLLQRWLGLTAENLEYLPIPGVWGRLTAGRNPEAGSNEAEAAGPAQESPAEND